MTTSPEPTERHLRLVRPSYSNELVPLVVPKVELEIIDADIITDLEFTYRLLSRLRHPGRKNIVDTVNWLFNPPVDGAMSDTQIRALQLRDGLDAARRTPSYATHAVSDVPTARLTAYKRCLLRTTDDADIARLSAAGYMGEVRDIQLGAGYSSDRDWSTVLNKLDPDFAQRSTPAKLRHLRSVLPLC